MVKVIFFILLGILTPLLVVGGPIWFMRLWTQLRRGRLYFFTTALRNCVRRNLPVIGAVHAVQADRVLRPNTLAGVARRLLTGHSLGQSLAGTPEFFPPDYVALIELGERTGQLPAVLDHLVADLDLKRRTRAYLFGRLAYPVILLIVYAGVLSFMMVKVIPKFRDIFTEFEIDLPPVTESMIDLGNILGDSLASVILWLFLLGLAWKLMGNLGVWHMWQGPRRLAGRIRGLLGIVSRYELATFAASMSAALDGGATVVEALTLSARCAREGSVKDGAGHALTQVTAGETLADALESAGTYPRTFLWMVRSGEAAGRLPEALSQLHVIYLQRAGQMVHFFGSMVIPAVTCFMAAIVLLLALGVLGSEISLLDRLSGATPR